MKLKYKQLRQMGTVAAIRKLSNHSFKTVKENYRVSRLVQLIEQELKLSGDLFIKLKKSYCILDEKGNPIFNKEKADFEIIPEKQEEHDKKLEEFYDHEVEIKKFPLEGEMLEGVGLTPQDIMNLENIVVFKDEE